MIRAVIDTNIIVSGLISVKNPPGIIIDSWLYGKFISVISEDMIEEISHTFCHAGFFMGQIYQSFQKKF